jgi:hypothetical protein
MKVIVHGECLVTFMISVADSAKLDPQENSRRCFLFSEISILVFFLLLKNVSF